MLWYAVLRCAAQAYEAGMIANTEEAMGEYVKALVRLDALDGSRLAATLQVRRAVPSGLSHDRLLTDV